MKRRDERYLTQGADRFGAGPQAACWFGRHVLRRQDRVVSAKALMAQARELLGMPAEIQHVDVLDAKLPK
jgi:hypothetical protein